MVVVVVVKVIFGDGSLLKMANSKLQTNKFPALVLTQLKCNYSAVTTTTGPSVDPTFGVTFRIEESPINFKLVDKNFKMRKTPALRALNGHI